MFNFNNVANKASRMLNKVGFQVKKYSPEILICAGVIGVGASGVMACRATTKLSDIINKANDDIIKTDEVIANPDMLPEGSEEYTEEDAAKDKVIIRAHMVMDIVKLYAPSVILGGLSLTAILTSNNILRKRNIALAAAYASTNKTLKEYRQRVVERFGEDVDKQLRFNTKQEEIETTVIDEKTGKEKKVKKTIEVFDPNTLGDFAVIFDESNVNWSKTPGANKMFLINQQRYLNDKLKAKGRLFVNDVNEALGFPLTAAGQVAGWVYDEEHPIGDNCIDFGLFDLDNPRAVDFINGYERSIIIDYNCDGNILKYLDEPRIR